MKSKLLVIILFVTLASLGGAIVAAAQQKSGSHIPSAQPAPRQSQPGALGGNVGTSNNPGNPNAPLAAVGSAFTYQGRLDDGPSPANGPYDLVFTLYDALTAGNRVGNPITMTNQTVTDGLFTVSLDFGSSAFQGSARWLQIAVQQTGGGGLTALSPRQPLTAAPYAFSLMPGAGITGTLGTSPVLSVTNTSTAQFATALYGNAPASSSLGVKGVGGFDGVWGTGGQDGVYGTSTGTAGAGVHGSASGAYAYGVRGEGGQYGVIGSGTYGVFGNGTDYGVYGTTSCCYGVYGETTGGSGYGVYGSSYNTAVYGAGGTYGVYGTGSYGVYGSGTGIGVYGYSTGSYGVYGASSNYGLYGSGTYGVAGYGSAGSGGIGAYGSGYYGVYGQQNGTFGSGYAGWFQGYTYVNGTLSAANKQFKIDDPLDPANKYLIHTSVESSDMMDIYDGEVTLDAKGEATVTMPAWFQALNRDFRYQLTAVGAPGPNLYIAQKIRDNGFKIAGGSAGTEVSWQVTGIRHDPYAEAHRSPVEQDKPADEKGYYLQPELYGQPNSKSVDPNVRIPRNATTPTGQPPRPGSK